MGIHDEVDRLLANLETVEKEKRVGMEIGKGILLHAATGEYLERVRRQDWESARDYLERIMVVVANMISYLPTGKSEDD